MTSTLIARPIETRLRPLYATGFIHGFALWYSIEKLFMRSIGLNDYLITIATLVYIVVMMIANIPLGTLRRFREPSLHRKAPESRLADHLGQILRSATKAKVALTRYLHDAMPSNIRAGASSVVSTIGYGVFIPAALGFGLTARAHGIFEASVFVVGALVVMCATLSVIVVKRS